MSIENARYKSSLKIMIDIKLALIINVKMVMLIVIHVYTYTKIAVNGFFFKKGNENAEQSDILNRIYYVHFLLDLNQT